MARRTPRNRPVPTSSAEVLLEAHVRFERERWSGEALSTVVRVEVDALYAWLASVRVDDVLPAADAAPAVARVLGGVGTGDETGTALGELLGAVRQALAESDLQVEDIVRRDDVLALAQTAAALDRLREEAIEAVTESTAYRRLVAHVLYRGVKAYVLTENVLARRIPGASSLVRLGQRGLNTAAPRLEQAVDKQLSAFVEANIAETLRDSRRYLEETLDAEMILALAEEAWDSTASRGLSDAAELASEEDLERLGHDLAEVAGHVLATGWLAQLVEAVVHDLLERHAGDSPADLLRGGGLDEETVASAIVELVDVASERPAVLAFVEERLRVRLAEFYLGEAYPLPD
jgi:hypothetical protein